MIVSLNVSKECVKNQVWEKAAILARKKGYASRSAFIMALLQRAIEKDEKKN